MTGPIRALVLVDAFRMGGAETLLAPMIVASRDTDVDMDVVSVSPAAMNSEKTMRILADAGITTRSLGIRRLLDPIALPRLASVIHRGGYDVVHAHLEMAMTLAVPAAALARRPVVCTFHHVARSLSGRAAGRERLAVEAASRSYRALFVSEASRQSFQESYRSHGMPDNWRVMHNGIDVANFTPGEPDWTLRAELSSGVDGPLVVLPGAFRDFKGIPVAIRAWPLIKRQFPDAVLALVGGGELEGELRELVAAEGVGDSVVFAGIRTNMPDVYRAADVVLVPSTKYENLPTVVIEASATACAIAASRIGGIPDIVPDGVTGLLFEPGSEEELAAAVCRLLGDADLRHRLGAAARERAHAEFSATSWVARLQTTYREAIGTHR
ncbi:glycosyltransferase [Mycolicibacterium hodleri]|uniref:Glycosyltransferase family 1 protein n=1 Tax=Mycolicibacterium hodleri TaxID=49897 RepID=A0A502E928_9MYCO|nr:glycosyltransferase [Mycolicibacterium hodleri]TPG34228.1 glycosyltransferase family 1 protein [Mycolicibacterium hodleri]